MDCGRTGDAIAYEGGNMRKRSVGSRDWLLIAGYLLVAILGYIDYLTGDYSILPFYLIPVLLVAWFFGCTGATFISLAAGLARFVSDSYGSSSATPRYWNSLQDTVFLFLVGFLVGVIKVLLNDDYR